MSKGDDDRQTTLEKYASDSDDSPDLAARLDALEATQEQTVDLLGELMSDLGETVETLKDAVDDDTDAPDGPLRGFE